MNYVDAIDVSGDNTPPVNAEQPPVQTLNEEVSEVIGRFNSFWGGFRKQASLSAVYHHKLTYFDDTVFDRLRAK
jgi:hypothetical protein